MGDKTGKQNVEAMSTGKSEPQSKAGTLTSEEPQHVDAQTSAQVGDSSNPTFRSQYASHPPHQHSDPSRSSGQNPYVSPGPQGQQHPYNMANMAGALPDYGQQMAQGYPQQPGPRQVGGASTPAIVYHMGQNLQYPLQAQYGTSTGYGSYGQLQYPSQYSQSPGSSPHGGYGSPYPQAQPRPPGALPGQYQQSPVPYYYYQDPYSHQGGSPTTYSPQSAQYSGSMRVGAPVIVSGQMADESSRRLSGGYGSAYQSASPSGEEGCRFSVYHSIKSKLMRLAIAARTQESAKAAIPRGPPRKPKQSGHALWVGNLPPNTSIMALKDHFSRDYKREIESLFLISKSNCAFVNYRTENACEKAVGKFHDSRFQGVRLVCRLRKSSASAPGAPSGPSSMATTKILHTPSPKPPVEDDVDDDDEEDIAELSTEQRSTSPVKSSERYFIVKSLTLQDLEQSVKNGIWATQSHNEDVLNKAYNVSVSHHLQD
jgi:YT521-B-like domain/RNA recognition motif. (a.k.a. RRM, RBD, or RNP domain)